MYQIFGILLTVFVTLSEAQTWYPQNVTGYGDICTGYCLNGGKCVRVDGQPYCDCSGTHAVGLQCEVDLCCEFCPAFAKCSGRPKCICHCPQGFSGKSCEREACGGSYGATDDISTIQSTLYPKGCATNENCLWTLYAVDKGNVVSLTITDVLPGTCNNTILTVTDGETHQPLLTVPCSGGDINVRSQSSRMVIHLQTLFNTYQPDCGFVANYKQEPGLPVNVCSNVTCWNGGICLPDSPYSFHCQCRYGFYGDYCQCKVEYVTTPNWTATTPFPYNYTTSSQGNWTTNNPSTPFPCYNGTCLNGGTCATFANATYCYCRPGYFGDHCQYSAITTTPDYPQSTTSDGETCNPWTCRNGGTCIQLPWYIYCQCPPNYNGQFCEYYAESSTYQPWSTTKNPDATSTTTGTGTTTAETCHPWTCKNGGTCKGTQWYFYCICTPEFNGRYCEIPNDYTPSTYQPWSTTQQYPDWTTNSDVRSCSPGSCLNGGTCISASPVFSYCQCRPNYNGYHCEFYTLSSTYPPVSTTKDPYTTTTIGTGTTTAETCHPWTCKNGGTCKGTNYYFYCICTPEFNGRYCENPRSPVSTTKYPEVPTTSGESCTPWTCNNGGTCIQSEWYVYCQCPPNYAGRFCDDYYDVSTYEPWSTTRSPEWPTTSKESCTPWTCRNGGSCVSNQWYVYCICPSGYAGQYCENVFTPPSSPETTRYPEITTTTIATGTTTRETCHPWTCKNGGTCRGTQWYFYCKCPPGFSGRYCEVPNSSVLPSIQTTRNDTEATTVAQVSTTKPSVVTTTKLVPVTTTIGGRCATEKCLNGGTCRNLGFLGIRFTCDCYPGFTGDHCELQQQT